MTSMPQAANAALESTLAEIERTLTRQSLHREILYKTLAFCQERRTMREVEDAIASFPEFKTATQNQYFLMNSLVEAGGLSRTFVDAAGEELDWENLASATDEEIDELIADELYETTDAGRQIVELHAPEARLNELAAEEPARIGAYRDVLAFCADSPRSYREVADLLAGSSALTRTSACASGRIQPSVLIDRLNVCGGIIWDGGWSTTREGKEFIAS